MLSAGTWPLSDADRICLLLRQLFSMLLGAMLLRGNQWLLGKMSMTESANFLSLRSHLESTISFNDFESFLLTMIPF